MLPRLLLVAAATIGLVRSSYVGDEYWSTVGFDGQLKDGRTTADFLPFERVDREGRRHLDAYVAYWITRTKYDPRQHYEAFGQAWIEDDGRICGRFVGYDRERVELCAGFRVLSKHATRNEPSPFKWVRGDEADLEHTVGFRDHRAAKLEWLGGEIFYGDARLSDKNFQGISPNYQQLVEIANPLEFTKKVSVLAKTTPDEASPRAPPAQPPAERPYDPYDREPARPAEPPKQPEPKPAIGEGAKPPPPKGYVYVRVPKQRTQTPTVVYVDRTGRIVGYGVRPVTRSNITYVNPHTARDAYAPQWRSGSSIQWGPGGAQWVGIRQGQQPAPAAAVARETPEGGEPKETKPVVDQRYSIPSYPAARSGYPYYPYAVPYAQPQVQPQPANPQRYLQRLQPARPPVEARAVQPEIVPLAQLKQQHARGQLTDERPRWQQRPDEEQPPVKTASKEDWLNSQRPVPLERRPPPPPPQGPPQHGKLPEPNESEYEDEDGEEDDGADYTKQ